MAKYAFLTTQHLVSLSILGNSQLLTLSPQIPYTTVRLYAAHRP